MMDSLFKTITLVDTGKRYSAAMNMAIDEALLARSSQPVLRVYGWRCSSVSFGYFDKWDQVRARYTQAQEFVRRWTGGGVVEHGEDFTYSLLVPSEAVWKVAAAQSYQLIHQCLAEALKKSGCEVDLIPEAVPRVSEACFENPAGYDVLSKGRKVAGAAQRRTRSGLLHQGSIQGLNLDPGFAELFAGRLAKQVIRESLNECVLSDAHDIASSRYGTREWLTRF